MRVNSKGQVTIPAELRHRLGIVEGDEVDVSVEGSTIRIAPAHPGASRGRRAVNRMRGSATVKATTDELMTLLRDDDTR